MYAPSPPSSERVLRAAPWVFVLTGIFAVASAVLLYWSFDEALPPPARSTLSWVGGLGLGFALFAFWFYRESAIVLTETTLTVRRPFCSRTFALHELKAVRVSLGMLVFETGRPPHFVVPAIYCGTARLVATLGYW